MSKFERVLSDELLTEIFIRMVMANSDRDRGEAESIWVDIKEDALSSLREIEQGILSGLAAEQEPVAWFIDDKRVCGNRIIIDLATAKDWLETNPDKVTPLYAHPMPNQARIKEALRFAAQVIELYDDATLVSDNYMLTSTDCAEIIKELVDYIPCVSTAIDKTACVSESGENDTQTASSPTKGMSLGERIAHVGGRENKDGYIEFGSVMAVHALISHVIRDLGGNCQGILDNSNQEKTKAINLLESLRLEYGTVGTRDVDVAAQNKRIDAAIEAIEGHIPDTGKKVVPEGFQLVPVEPDQALLTSMACCLNHGFGLLTKEKQDGQLYDMRKLYDEVVGKGYYSLKNRERYLAMLAAAPKYTGDKQ